MNRQRVAVIASTLVGLIILGSVAFHYYGLRNAELAELHQHARAAIGEVAAKLGKCLSVRIHFAKALGNILAVDESPAPDTVRTYIQRLTKGHAPVLGMSLTTSGADPIVVAQSPALESTIKHHLAGLGTAGIRTVGAAGAKPTVGTTNLGPQMERVIAAHWPITDANSGTDADGSRRAVASIFLSLPEIMEEAGVDKVIENLNFSVVQVFEGADSQRLVFGTPAPDTIDAVKTRVRAPGVKWELAASPSVGWSALVAEKHPGIIGEIIATLIIAAIASVATYLIIKAPAVLEKRVTETTRALRHQRDELEKMRDAAEEANRTKTRFLATMSHEIRTPLSAMLGSIGLLLEQPIESRARKLASTAKSSGEHLLKLLSDILDLSRADELKLEIQQVPFSPLKVSEEVLQQAEAEAMTKGLRLSSQLDPRLPGEVQGDPSRIRQILANLVFNAVKFTSVGEVRVQVYPVRFNRDVITVRFLVEDTGIGVADEHKATIFEAFTQVDGSYARVAEGAGLGLAISKRLVELMHGTIDFQSTAEVGSRFWFDLPLRRTAELVAPEQSTISQCTQDCDQEEPAASPEEAAIHSGAKVIIAEDSPANRMVLTEYLRSAGYRVDVATNGQQVVELTNENAYDLVLMDISMPVKDGIEATHSIRCNSRGQTPATVPIIALSAHAFDDQRDIAMGVGVDEFITKPIEKKRLIRAIEDLLTKHGQAFSDRTIHASGHA
jgi:signal transduction histidine kinase/ActR/RegA family two-component response regulator